MTMGMPQGGSHVTHDLHYIVQTQVAFAKQSITKALAFDIGHDVIQQPVGFTRIVQRQDVGMGQPRGNLDLVQEPPRADSPGQLGVEYLDGYSAPMLYVD